MTATTTSASSAAQQQQQQQQQPPEPPRMEHTVACLPIVYGSIAFPLNVSTTTKKGQVAVGDSTHEWTLYLRGPNMEELSLCIEKAVFHLHPSFAQPVRELTKAPYEVTERGWGEFEAQIRIYWKDFAHEKSTVVTHLIRLYPPPQASGVTAELTNDPVVSESYDEVVFTNPTEPFFEQLVNVSASPAVADQSHQRHFQRYHDADDFLALLEAQKFLQQELLAVKDRLVLVDRELEQTDDDLRLAQEAAKAAAAATTTTTTATTTTTMPVARKATTPKAARTSNTTATATPTAKRAKATAAAATTTATTPVSTKTPPTT